MRQAKILFKEEEAGTLSQLNDGSFSFIYNDSWIENSQKPSISLSLPKTKKQFISKTLFPFFINLLPEGDNKTLICKYLQIDKDDYFSLLMHTAKLDSVGAIRVIKFE